MDTNTNIDGSTPLFDWLDTRSAGVLLHLSSLPSCTGIGNLGISAYRFVGFYLMPALKFGRFVLLDLQDMGTHLTKVSRLLPVIPIL